MDIDYTANILYTYVYEDEIFDSGGDYTIKQSHQTFFNLCRIDLTTGTTEIIDWDGYQKGMYRTWGSCNDLIGYGYWETESHKVGATNYRGYSKYEKPLMIVLEAIS